MADRVLVQEADGTTRPAAAEVVCGSWWTDNWITPLVQLKLRGMEGVTRLVLAGFAAGIAPRQIENRLIAEAGGARLEQPLPWGKLSDATLTLPAPAGDVLELRIEVEKGLAGDGLDGRERGIVLRGITALRGG